MIKYIHDDENFVLTVYHDDTPEHPLAWIDETGDGFDLHTYFGATIRHYDTLTDIINEFERLLG